MRTEPSCLPSRGSRSHGHQPPQRPSQALESRPRLLTSHQAHGIEPTGYRHGRCRPFLEAAGTGQAQDQGGPGGAGPGQNWDLGMAEARHLVQVKAWLT